MSVPRLKTDFRVAAILRRAESAAAFATIVARGDPDAGAIALKIYLGGGLARLYTEARNADGGHYWREPLQATAPDSEIDAYLAKERRFDPDLWIVEIEDREGRTFVD